MYNKIRSRTEEPVEDKTRKSDGGEGVKSVKDGVTTRTPSSSSSSSSSPTCWSSVLQNLPVPKPQEPISSRVFGRCNSSSGVSVAIFDANAIISDDKIAGAADKFVTVSEVLEEVRDPVSRQRMAFLPLFVDSMSVGSSAQTEVSCVSWNPKFQTYISIHFEITVVWDLKQQKLLTSIPDSTKRRCSVLQWIPDVSTQLIMASDDDNAPALTNFL